MTEFGTSTFSDLISDRTLGIQEKPLIIPPKNIGYTHHFTSIMETATVDLNSLILEGIDVLQSNIAMSVVGTFNPKSLRGHWIEINQIRDIKASIFDVPKIPYDPLKQFEKERKAFEKCLDELMEDYKGKFVAFLNGNVVDSDNNNIKLAKRVYDKYGYVPIYIQKVEKEIPIIKAPAPKIISGR